MYSNCCCGFSPGILKIGQSSHKMYSNNILNFQVSLTILNACIKKSGNLLHAPRMYLLYSDQRNHQLTLLRSPASLITVLWAIATSAYRTLINWTICLQRLINSTISILYSDHLKYQLTELWSTEPSVYFTVINWTICLLWSTEPSLFCDPLNHQFIFLESTGPSAYSNQLNYLFIVFNQFHHHLTVL